MPPEPKKSIEELLETAAQERRAEFGADPAMPNPMRARLHAEIAALGERQAAIPRRPWFGLSWPRLVLGTAFASLLLGIGVLIWKSEQAPNESGRLALGDRPEMAAPRAAQISAPEKKDKYAGAAGATAKGGVAETAASAPQDGEHLFAQSTARDQPAAQNFRPAAPVASAREDTRANLTQQFSQTAAKEALADQATARPGARLLDNFQVQQNGRDFRVVDADGSTYSGRIEALAPNEAGKPAAKARSAGATRARPAPAAPEADNEFHFRASGYNGSLKKALVFEGSYIVDAPPPAQMPDEARAKNPAPPAARIVGTAQVAGEAPVPVNAVAVPPK